MSVIRYLIITFILATGAFAGGQNKVIVKATPIRQIELFDLFTVTGQCHSEKSRSYYAGSEGIVDYISAKEGQKIAEGDLILTINKKIAESTKDQAMSTFGAAELNYKRSKALKEGGYVSTQGFEKIKIEYDNAKLNLEKANKQYDDLVIKAPFSGILGVIKVRIGSKINIGDYLFDITASDNKTLVVGVPENLYNKIKIGDNLFLKDSNGNKSSGKIIAIAKNLSSNGTLEVKVKIEANDDFIDGSYLNAEFIFGRHFGISVPESAVSRNEQGNFVYLIDNNKVIKQIYVELGTRLGDRIEIINKTSNTQNSEMKALNEGNLIVMEGLTKVSNGTEVELQE